MNSLLYLAMILLGFATLFLIWETAIRHPNYTKLVGGLFVIILVVLLVHGIYKGPATDPFTGKIVQLYKLFLDLGKSLVKGAMP